MTAFEKLQPASPDQPEVHGASGRALSIALLSYRSHPYCGGQGVYIHYLSKALVEAGHRVDVISAAPYPTLDKRVNLIKLPSLNLFDTQERLKAWRFRYLHSYTDCMEFFSVLSGGFPEPYTFGRRVVKYFQKHGHKYDVIHDNQSLSYGLITLQKMELPVVATIHHPITRDRRLALEAESDWGMRLLIRRWYSFLSMQKKVARKLNHLVTVSDVSKRDIEKDFKVDSESLSVIHNGIDLEVFRPMPAVERQPFRIITTASADQPLKGLRYLLEAFADLRQQLPDISLTIIGKPNPDSDTGQLIEKWQLQDCVDFVSGISNEELVACYASSSLAVSPSLYEGFGFPAGEAMACEVPLVSSDGGALPEVVGEAGLVVPAGDASALKTAMLKVLTDEVLQQRLAKAGRERVEKLFSWQLVAKKLTDYYMNHFSDRMQVRHADS